MVSRARTPAANSAAVAESRRPPTVRRAAPSAAAAAHEPSHKADVDGAPARRYLSGTRTDPIWFSDGGTLRTHGLLLLAACRAAPPIDDPPAVDTTAPPAEDASHGVALDENPCLGAPVPWEVVGAGPSTTYERTIAEQDAFNFHRSAVLHDAAEVQAWLEAFGSPGQPVDAGPWAGRSFIGVCMEGSADNSQVVIDCLYASGDQRVGLVVHTLQDTVNGYWRAWLLVAIDPTYQEFAESYWTSSEFPG